MKKIINNLEDLNSDLRGRTAEEIIGWTLKEFHNEIVVSSSFQTQSVPLMHMVSRLCPDIKILFIDTGFHFPETLEFKDTLASLLGLNVHIIKTENNQSSVSAPLYKINHDECCHLHKVTPMKRALSDLNVKAWIFGIRSDQTDLRRNINILECNPDGILRVHPFACWTAKEILNYIEHNNLPVHPLYHKGYSSVGCKPCTAPSAGNDDRNGRWYMTSKTECGLYEDNSYASNNNSNI